MTDLFGEEYTPPERRKMGYESAYQLFKRVTHYRRSDTAQQCRFCIHRDSGGYRTKMLHKCKLMGLSHSEASDIRLRNVCDKFEDNL